MNELMRRILFLPPQESTVARMVDTLHYIVILMTWPAAPCSSPSSASRSSSSDRRRTDVYVAHPDANTRPPMWFEISAIGSLFLLFIVFWVIGVRSKYTDLRVPPEGAMPVYVASSRSNGCGSSPIPKGAKSLEVLQACPRGAR